MNTYKQRQLVKEVEWNCRAALSTADDLDDAVRAGSGEQLTAVVGAFALRIQTIAELLWAGKYRLSDYVFASECNELRRRLGIQEDSPLVHDRLIPLYELLRGDLDRDPLVADDPSAPVVRSGSRRYDLRPLLDELRRVWDRASDLVVGG